MDIHKATYSHDHQKIAEFLDNGGVLDAAGLCNLVLFDSKSETL